LLNSHDQKLTLYHPVDIRKQSALEEVEEPDSESVERTMLVLKLTEGLGLLKVASGSLSTFMGTSSEQQQLDTEL
jgi:hypothetical protein